MLFQSPPPPEVTVANPIEEVVEEVRHFTGVTEPFGRVEIRARVAGFLDQIKFVEGDNVQEEELLFVVDPRPYQANLDAARAALSVARADRASSLASLRQAETQAKNDEAQYTRARSVSVSGAVTESELDELRTVRDNAIAGIDVAKAGIATAEAGIAAAESAVQKAELDYDYTHIKSPMAGRIGRHHVDLGNLVGSGEATLLAEVISYDPIHVTFTVSEAEYLRYARRAIKKNGVAGQETSETNQHAVRLGLADEEGFPRSGYIDFADLAVDPTSGTYLVRAVFSNHEKLIVPGAFVRIEVPLDKRPVLLIEEMAVGQDQNGDYVTVLDTENRAVRRRIQTGRTHAGKVSVLSGLAVTDAVIVNGVQKARPGDEVTPIRAEPKPTE